MAGGHFGPGGMVNNMPKAGPAGITLEGFQLLVKNRDLLAEFVVWYKARQLQHPENYHSIETSVEWLGHFGRFLMEECPI